MYQKIHVIINPAAGKDEPVLNTLNRVFTNAGVDWEVFITQKNSDAQSLAKEALNSGAEVVAAYGGDGTVGDVAAGLIGSDVPLSILPGGTGNAMSNELGIPKALDQAASLLCSTHAIRTIDVGKIGEHYFLLRAGIGYDALMIKNATREQKNRLGVLAYPLAALSELTTPPRAHYTLKLTDKEIEVDGVTCMVVNSGAIGLAGLSLASGIDIADGKLDVLVMQDTDLRSLLAVAVSVIGSNATNPTQAALVNQRNETLRHWQSSEVTVQVTPPQEVHCDGESRGQTPVTFRNVPKALRVIVPNATAAEP